MQWRKADLLLIGFVALCSGISFASEEITVDLPGGAKMEMVWIEPGTFMMGTTEEQKQLMASKGLWSDLYKNEQPAHQVTISKGYYLGKYEITQEQWETAMGTKPWKDDPYLQENPSHPAEDMTWNNVQSLIHQLNIAAGDSLYRLPTEAEWEYACRAGTTTLWSFGDDVSRLGEYAQFRDNTWAVGLTYAQAVGMKLPNPWGLYDMYGNEWEWCQDGFSESYYSNSPTIDPLGPSDSRLRIARGGCAVSLARDTRSANRNLLSPDTNHTGARLLRMGPKITTAITPQGWGQIKKDSR